MLLKFLMIAALVPACVFALNVRDCPNGVQRPLTVMVPGCNVEPCLVRNGDNFEFTVNFMNQFATATLTADAEAFLSFIRLPFEIPEEKIDACQFLTGGSCPLAGGEVLAYTLQIPVEAPIADVTVALQFQLINSAGNAVFCFRADVTLF